MIDLGPHADYIIYSYVVTIIVVAALFLWTFLDEAGQRKKLKELEEQGIVRRSAAANLQE